jgi:two-component system sensor histidine kinase RpfC
MGIVSLLVLYFGIGALVAPAAAPLTLIEACLYGLGYLAIGAGYFAWILARPRPSPTRRLLAMITDQTNVAVLIGIGGAWGGALYPVYLWITFGNGFRYGNAYLAAAAGYSALTFIIAAWLHPFWSGHVPLTIGLTLGLIGLPAYGAGLIRRLTEAKRAAEAANQAKSRFLATMSHELRTPLNAVIGLSEMLSDGRLDRDQADMVTTINRSGRALLTLINDILDHAKIESGNARIAERDFNLAAEIANTVSIVRPQAEAKELGLAPVVDADVPVCIRSDPACLRHILLNLLANALKFTETGGAVLRVSATSRQDGHDLVFAVEDTGIGIAPENQTQIFETFTQTEQHRGRRHEGSGLGLAIARQLAELMGGALSVESSPGAGSRFTLTLPVGLVEDPTARDASAPAHAPGQSRDPAAPVLDLRAPVGTVESWPEEVQPRTVGGAVAITAVNAAVPAALARRLGAAVRLQPPLTPARRTAAADLLITMRDQTAEPANEPNAHPVEPPASDPATILVVEDNAVNRKVTAKILRRAGHTAVPVDSGDAALDRIAGGGIDAVLMDVNMPDSNGLETTQLFRYTELGASARLPIIALTADATDATRTACRDAGMDDYLVKPVAPNTLLRTLAAHLPERERPTGEATAERKTTEPTTSTRAETVSTPSGQPILDTRAVATLHDLDPDGHFLLETLDTFFAEVTTLLDAIASRLSRGDVAATRDDLHALKSAAGNVGAARLRAHIREIDACLAVDPPRITADAVVRGLRDEVEAYRDAIGTLTARSSDGDDRPVVTIPYPADVHNGDGRTRNATRHTFSSR